MNDSSSRVEFEEKPGRDALSHATVTTPSQTSNQEREEREELRDPELWKDQLAQSLDVIVTAGKGIGRATKAYLASPLHFSLALARGFQNIPVAYGDTMVRKPEKVQGAISGMRIGARVGWCYPAIGVNEILTRTGTCVRILRWHYRCCHTAY